MHIKREEKKDTSCTMEGNSTIGHTGILAYIFFLDTGKSYLIIVRVYTTIAISGLKGHSLLIHRLAISFTKH